MNDRIVRWMVTVAFAVLPLAVTVLLNLLAGQLSLRVLADAPEVLFLSIMCAATAWNDLREFRDKVEDPPLKVASVGLVFLAIFSAILYGFHAFSLHLEAGPVSFRTTLLIISLILALVTLWVTTHVQVLIKDMEAS